MLLKSARACNSSRANQCALPRLWNTSTLHCTRLVLRLVVVVSDARCSAVAALEHLSYVLCCALCFLLFGASNFPQIVSKRVASLSLRSARPTAEESVFSCGDILSRRNHISSRCAFAASRASQSVRHRHRHRIRVVTCESEKAEKASRRPRREQHSSDSSGGEELPPPPHSHSHSRCILHSFQ